jgi:HAD superfamily hydrolase (TIGR01509 family)
MGVKGVIFDSDGVIFDSEGVHYLAFKEAFAMYGFDLSQDHFDRLKGMSSPDIIRDCFHDANDNFILRLSRERSELFVNKYSSKAPLVKGVKDFIRYLSENGYGMIVVTNGLKENINAMMKHHNMNLNVLAAKDFVHAKPHPAGYIMALRKLSLKADDAVVFEDSPLGIRAAKSAGIMTIGIMSDHDEKELLLAGADAAIMDFSDMNRMKEILDKKV